MPGIGFTMASCSAYMIMNGVMIPGVSAGSNQVGASEMWTPQVICPSGAAVTWLRSEEHTSELQSHHDLVCRLLLEKKNNSTTTTDCSTPAKRPRDTGES